MEKEHGYRRDNECADDGTINGADGNCEALESMGQLYTNDKLELLVSPLIERVIKVIMPICTQEMVELVFTWSHFLKRKPALLLKVWKCLNHM